MITVARTIKGHSLKQVGGLTYASGPRTDDACHELPALFTPLNTSMTASDDRGCNALKSAKGKASDWRIIHPACECNHLILRICIKRLICKTLCFSRSVELHEKSHWHLHQKMSDYAN